MHEQNKWGSLERSDLTRALSIAALCPILFGYSPNTVAETLSGQITPARLANGSPAGAGITVFASGSAGHTIGQGSSTISDVDGNFSFDLAPGSWSIRLDHKAAAQRGILTPERFQSITAGESVSDFQLEVFQPSIEVQATLTSDQGNPIPHINFSGSTIYNDGGYNLSATTDANGKFTIAVFASEWTFSAFGLPDEFQRPRSQTVSISETTQLEFIAATGGPRLTISPDVLPAATAGESYNTTLTAEGGGRPHLWTVAPGSSLPPNLEITEFGGQIRGLPTQSGTFHFTIEASTFSGSVTGQRTFTLQVQPDTTPPTIRKTTPGRLFSVRDNSVIAIHFSEPMFKINMSDPSNHPFQLQWQTGTSVLNRREIDPTELLFEWNEPGDTLYIGHRDIFPQGTQTWTLNPGHLEDQRSPMDPIPFQDSSGNEIALDTRQSFKVSRTRVEPGEGEETDTIYRDVDQVWLVKNHSYDNTQTETPFRLGTFGTVIHLPEHTWNTIRSASVTLNNGEPQKIDYFGFEPAGRLLNLSSSETSPDSLDQRHPNGQYTITLETVHDGRQVLPLSIQGNTYPRPLRLEQFCRVHSREEDDGSFLLKFRAILGETGVTYTHLMISEFRGQKVINLRETPGGSFESIVDGSRYGFVIPPGTLDDNKTYHGFLRRISIVDTNTQYTHASVNSAYTTTTEFEISTSDELLCGAFTAHVIAPINADIIGDPFRPEPGTPLPPHAFITTNATDPAIITLAGGSTIEVGTDSEGILDTSEQGTTGIGFQLNSGRLLVTATALDVALGTITMLTPTAHIELEPGTFEIHHDPADGGSTRLDVSEGQARVHSTSGEGQPLLALTGTSHEFGPTTLTPTPIDTTPPQLRILRNENGTLTVHWEAPAPIWTLESSASLSIGSTWTTEASIIDPATNRFLAQITPSQASQFFRLRHSE